MRYTNNTHIQLVPAVWLASDHGYDLKFDPTKISATTLMNPIKSIILTRRVSEKQKSIDLSDLVPSALGTAVHNDVEHAWTFNREKALDALPNTYNHKNVLFNPPIRVAQEGANNFNLLVIYMEQRAEKAVEVDGITWTISGKFDAVVGGQVQDIKTTKVYNWIKGTNNAKYALQGSIYRWLNTDIITDDQVTIHYIFTDWVETKTGQKDYPQKRISSKTFMLKPVEEVEQWVTQRLKLVNKYINSPADKIPDCTPEELWMDPPKWAYYKDKNRKARATKLYDNAYEAHEALKKTPNGTVEQRIAEPKFCRYCSAIEICPQAERYIQQGILKA